MPKKGSSSRRTRTAAISTSKAASAPEAADARILGRLDELVAILRRAHPTPTNRWHERVYTTLQAFTKYVGIPALLLASVSPVITAFESYREHRNKLYLAQTYTSYAEDLLARGAIARAHDILLDLDSAEKRDVRTQYVLAKTATLEAIKQGKNYQQAEDRANVLLHLHRNRGPLFPSFGGEDEVTDLQFAVVDINLQLGRYDQAVDILGQIERDTRRARSVFRGLSRGREPDRELLKASIALRRGTLAVLRYDFSRAIAILPRARRVFEQSGRPDLAADATFQLAKAYQFTFKSADAIRAYSKAREFYIARGDEHGVMRINNNLGMIEYNEHNLSRSNYYFGLAEAAGRRLGDNLAIARALVNMATIDLENQEYSSALKKTLESQEAFRLADNKLGIATSTQALASLYRSTGDTAKAIYNAEQAAAIFRDMSDLRGLASACTVLSQMMESIKHADDETYYALLAFVLRRHIGQPDASVNLSALERLRDGMGTERFAKALANAEIRIQSVLVAMNVQKVSLAIPEDLGQ
jgi:hypothetical protein